MGSGSDTTFSQMVTKTPPPPQKKRKKRLRLNFWGQTAPPSLIYFQHHHLMCSYGSGFLIIPTWSWLSVSSKCPLTLDGIWQVPIDTALQAGRHCERTIQTRPLGVALHYWQAYFKRQLQKGPSTRRFNAGFNSILEFYDSNNSHFLEEWKK